MTSLVTTTSIACIIASWPVKAGRRSERVKKIFNHLLDCRYVKYFRISPVGRNKVENWLGIESLTPQSCGHAALTIMLEDFPVWISWHSLQQWPLFVQVLIYNGQLDVIIPVPATERFLMTVPWQYLDEYKQVERHIWKVQPEDVEVAGFVRRVHDFYQVIVRSAGHILPHDQPERGFDLIDRFISGKPFF